jgi:signal transduction histidine kinase
MKSVSVVVLSLLVLALAGGGVYLAMWEIPAPKAKVEKVIPDERFPR